MSLSASTIQSLRRVFQQGFVVHDITEPLVSFDAETSANKVRQLMTEQRFELVGVRQAGRVEGYVELADLAEGNCGDHLRVINDSLIVPDSMPLAELVRRLSDQRRLFVSILGSVGGIVSRTDLEKPPVRMWLFGMVTLIEMRISRMIEQFYRDDTWQQCLSVGRLQKAKELLAERSRRNQELSLQDCLQLSDKVQIVARTKQLLTLTRFESRRQLEAEAKLIEKLRNNLAHSQDITTGDWETILALSENLDTLLEGPPGGREHV